jgi:hypothetical protein
MAVYNGSRGIPSRRDENWLGIRGGIPVWVKERAIVKKYSKRWVYLWLIVGIVFVNHTLIAGLEARAVDYFAATINGDWNNPATWTPVSMPGASDNVYIGSGAAATATVNLTQNQSAGTLQLGYGDG